MKQYVVDAFTDRVFGGNPAAVCVMDKWLDEETMMNITRENNLSETAFCVPESGRYRLRWFTPGGEIDLCGHATLGTAYVIMNYVEPEKAAVSFDTLSGELTVVRKGELYEMDFPAYDLRPVEVTDAMADAIGVRPIKAFMGRDLLCVLENEEQVRSFAPKLYVAEDPVCGSGHCHIVPYWVGVKGSSEITAYQASRRGGTLYCRQEGERIKMSGKAVTYSVAEINF